MSLYPTGYKQTTRWFLTELRRYYRLNNVEFLVDNSTYFGPVLAEDCCLFRVIRRRNRNAIERVSSEMKRQTTSFVNTFNNVALQTAQNRA